MAVFVPLTAAFTNQKTVHGVRSASVTLKKGGDEQAGWGGERGKNAKGNQREATGIWVLSEINRALELRSEERD